MPTWSDNGIAKTTAPYVIVSAFAPVPMRGQRHSCASIVAIPCWCRSIWSGKRRLGASSLAQVYGQLGNDAPDLDDHNGSPRNLVQGYAGHLLAYRHR